MATIRKEWKEFYRTSLIYLVVGLIILTSTFVLLQFTGMDVNVSFRSGLVPVFQTSLYFLPLIALAYGALAMANEKTDRTLPILLARGISVKRFVLKKFASLFAVFLPVVVGSYFLAMIPARFIFCRLVVSDLLYFLLSVLILSTVFLALGMLIGAWINQKLRLIGAVIGVWLILLCLFDLVLMYVMPHVSISQVFVFSLVYFLSPINAVQYFLLSLLNIFQLSDLSAYYKQLTFQMPGLVVLSNLVFWVSVSVWGSILGLRKKGMSRD